VTSIGDCFCALMILLNFSFHFNSFITVMWGFLSYLSPFLFLHFRTRKEWKMCRDEGIEADKNHHGRWWRMKEEWNELSRRLVSDDYQSFIVSYSIHFWVNWITLLLNCSFLNIVLVIFRTQTEQLYSRLISCSFFLLLAKDTLSPFSSWCFLLQCPLFLTSRLSFTFLPFSLLTVYHFAWISDSTRVVSLPIIPSFNFYSRPAPFVICRCLEKILFHASTLGEMWWCSWFLLSFSSCCHPRSLYYVPCCGCCLFDACCSVPCILPCSCHPQYASARHYDTWFICTLQFIHPPIFDYWPSQNPFLNYLLVIDLATMEFIGGLLCLMHKHTLCDSSVQRYASFHSAIL